MLHEIKLRRAPDFLREDVDLASRRIKRPLKRDLKAFIFGPRP
jgi:hypothetical protein